MTAHVWRYWRWKGWVAEKCNKHWSAFLFREFAKQELYHIDA